MIEDGGSILNVVRLEIALFMRIEVPHAVEGCAQLALRKH
jgi:hypothetical protein